MFTPQNVTYLPNGATLDGSESRDPTNTGDLDELQPGLLMGIITASGLWAPSYVGLLTAAYTSGGVSLTVGAATAVELARLVGQTGTSELVCIGAPSAAGTVASTAFTHSAIDVVTGIITVTSLGVNKTSGAIIAVNDGRQTPLGAIATDYPVKVTDQDGTSVDTHLPSLMVGGFVDTDQIINYPAAANTTLTAYVQSRLRLAGAWTFSDTFGV